ncbi:hypothetical protein [Vibrio sp. C8]
MNQSSHSSQSELWFYRRPELAIQMSNMCQDTLFSRIAYFGEPRIGKSHFFLNELKPMLIQDGMKPIYISMQGNAPHVELTKQLSIVLDELENDGVHELSIHSGIIKQYKENLFADMALESQPRAATSIELSNIKLYLNSLVEVVGSPKIVLVLDDFQHLSTSSSFDNFIYALRTQFDKYGSRITVIFIGSSRVQSLFEDDQAAFYQSAQVKEFPDIDEGFVDYCSNRLKGTYNIHIKRQVLLEFWTEINHSPYWMIKLMHEMVENQRDFVQAIARIREEVKAEKR